MNYDGSDLDDLLSFTQLPGRHVKVTRKPWTCHFCRHESPAGTPCYVQPMIIEGEFGSYRACTPNGDCMSYDRTPHENALACSAPEGEELPS